MEEIKNKLLNKEQQEKLGVDFVSFNIRVDFDDYNYYEFDLTKNEDLNENDFKDIEMKIQGLKNSDDYYYVDIYTKYKLIRDDISIFNFNSFDRKSDDEIDFNYIYSNYCEYRILTNTKPEEDIIYSELRNVVEHIISINGEYSIERINTSIKLLEELKETLIK